MGNLFQKIRNLFGSSDKKANLLISGIDCAGKTTILYQLVDGESRSHAPTIGFNVEKVQVGQLNIYCWDIGGGYHLQERCQHYYYENLESYIRVIDSSDVDRLQDQKYWLDLTLNHPKFPKNIPILILANKQDISKISIYELQQQLQLQKIKDRNWNIMPCCGLNGEGLQEAFEWVAEQIKLYRKQYKINKSQNK